MLNLMILLGLCVSGQAVWFFISDYGVCEVLNREKSTALIYLRTATLVNLSVMVLWVVLLVKVNVAITEKGLLIKMWVP